MTRRRNTYIETRPPEKRCPECHGKGEVPSGDGFNEPCRECGGGGYIYDDEGQWPDVDWNEDDENK